MTGHGPMVLGIDLSTKRVDCAAIPLNEEPRLGRNIQLTYCDIDGSPKNPAERCVAAGQAARTCLHALHARGIEIHSAGIEEPFGSSRKGDRALLPILGAITHAMGDTAVQWWAPASWRKQIGVTGRSKDAGHIRILGLLSPGADLCDAIFEVTELIGGYPATVGDQLDAIGVALATRNFQLAA